MANADDDGSEAPGRKTPVGAPRAAAKNWLPGLDGVRALAALAVVYHHAEQVRFIFGLPSSWQTFPVIRLGGLGVSLFFVLSGFLITHLLLKERREFGAFSVKMFYVRRILRIWPLYFIITALGFFVLPHIGAFDLPGTTPVTADDLFYKKLALYLAFSPHVATAIYVGVNYAGVLWSVGVEEWFYLTWPWLCRVRKAALIPILVAIVVILTAARAMVTPQTALAEFLSQLRFDCMSIGALGALIFDEGMGSRLVAAACRWSSISSVVERLRALGIPFLARRILLSWPAQILLYATLVNMVVKGKYFWTYDELVYSLVFILAILNAAYNPNAIRILDLPPLRWIGKISYGVYCYNWITLVATVALLKASPVGLQGATGAAAFYSLGLGLTLGLSALSYYMIEQPFLRLKKRDFTAHAPDAARSGAR